MPIIKFGALQVKKCILFVLKKIQTNVKMLTNERDKFNQMYEEARDELHRARREMLKGAKTSNASLAVQTVLKRVESERDSALYDLRNADSERDSLRDKLKVKSFASFIRNFHK